MNKLSIKDWDESDRPREKLIRHGAKQLTNAELLTILIGSGTTRLSALDVSRNLMHACNDNLNTLARKPLQDLMRIEGIGQAKAVTIMAACELSDRMSRATVEEHPIFADSQSIYRWMHTEIGRSQVEQAWVLLLNQACKLLKAVRLSVGGLTETAVDLRLMLREALMANATVVALCHNHPSNNPVPSTGDDRITRQAVQACEVMRIHFLDHIIVCDDAYFSYRDEGRI